MVARQAGGEQPLRSGMALLRAWCIRQTLPQFARELPNDVLESDQPVGQLARSNPEKTPRSEHIQVELVAGLLTVMASDRGTVPYPCQNEPTVRPSISMSGPKQTTNTTPTSGPSSRRSGADRSWKSTARWTTPPSAGTGSNSWITKPTSTG